MIAATAEESSGIGLATADALPVLLGLGQRARQAASIEELRFVMVNETVALAPYRQAVLAGPGGGILAVSGVAAPERNAPFTIWLARLLRSVIPSLDGPRELREGDAPDPAQWAEWLPPYLLVLPLRDPDHQCLGVVAFARAQPWSAAETLCLGELAETYALVWAWRDRPTLRSAIRRRVANMRYRSWVIAAALLAVAALPVRLSVLAPGEIVARDPAAIRAPIEGVIDKVLVSPNQQVAAGQLLFELDTTTVRGKLEVAEQTLTTARAAYDQASLQAFSDPKAKAELGVLAGRIGERKAEIADLAGLLERASVHAPRAGVAILDDPSDWVGRPVSVGEKVLAIADQRDAELEGWLAPGDLIDLPTGAPATLFLNVDPIHPVHAALRYVAYEGSQRPDGSFAYRLRAAITDPGARLRLGLKGTIRLDGHYVLLVYWIFRRPWAAIRQTLGI